jgi:hypothetical protein
MMMLLLSVVIVGVSAYVWCTRGFFSALLHLMCVFAAGAIAFGVWEPLAYLILEKAPDRGFGSWLADMPFAIALVIPFAVSLFIIRSVVDKLLPANAQCDTAVDYVGGGICGLLSGVITAGVVMIGINYLRVKPSWGGYTPVVFSGSTRGALEKSPDKMVPWVDRITANLYSNLSFTTLRTGEPLGRYYPDIVGAGGANRQTFEGKGRTGIKPEAVDLVGWYTVGDFTKPQKMSDLTKDIRQMTPQKATTLSGDEINQGALVGYILNFGTKAREGSGQVVVGNGQVRLVCESTYETDEYVTVHPIAVVSRANDPAVKRYARFRFDSDGFFITSVGGESQAVLGFEFPVPENYKPIALYVRNYRIKVDQETMAEAGERAKPIANFSDPLSRDAMIMSGQLKGMTDVGPILDAEGNPVAAPQAVSTLNEEPVRISNALGFTIQKGTEQGLRLAEKEKGGYVIQEGEFKTTRTVGFGQVDRNLTISEFEVSQDTVMVQVDLSPRNRGPEISRILDTVPKDAPIVLGDTEGTRYEAVGFVYEEEPSLKHIRYTRSTPLRGMNEAGDKPVTQNTPNRKIRLLFIVSRGVTVKDLRIGDVTVQDGINLNTNILGGR